MPTLLVMTQRNSAARVCALLLLTLALSVAAASARAQLTFGGESGADEAAEEAAGCRRGGRCG
jgi:hypothetical protein